jgi:O-antigen/teichoic acid export membrane protein
MVSSVSKNMISVYIADIVPAGLTFLFWIIVANVTDSEVIGIVVVITSFSFVLGTISGFDTSISLRGYLGKAVAEEKWEKFKQFSWSAIVFNIITSTGILIIVLNPFVNLLDIVEIDDIFVPLIITVVLVNGVINIIVSILISSLNSKKLILPYLLSSLARFPILFILIFFESSSISVAWAYSSSYIILFILLITTVSLLLKNKEGKFENFLPNVKKLVRAGLAKWIPTIVSVLGVQLGVLILYVEKGASATGFFYISFSIYNVLSMIPAAMVTVGHPLMSGMNTISEQKVFLDRIFKMGFLFTMPIASCVIFYSQSIMSIFGSEFIVSKEVLALLVFSLPLYVITNGAFYMYYARAEYRKVLYLGLIANIPRIVLYFLIIPELGADGGAISFVIGTLFQMILTVIYLERSKLRLEYKSFAIMTVIPLGIGYLMDQSDIGLIGVAIIILTTLAIFVKIKYLDESIIQQSLSIIYEKERAAQSSQKVVQILKKIKLM